MEDIVLKETGNSGDIQHNNGDIQLTSSFATAVYIAMFGGVDDVDFWGKNLLNDAFRSQTLKTIQTYALTKSNLLRIQSAIEIDLADLYTLADIEIQCTLIGYNKLQIQIKLTELKTSKTEQISLIWDGIKKDILL